MAMQKMPNPLLFSCTLLSFYVGTCVIPAAAYPSLPDRQSANADDSLSYVWPL